MTEITLIYVGDEKEVEKEEVIKCNYTKTREGWLEIALNSAPPFKRIFIPAHRLERVTTRDIDDGIRNEEQQKRERYSGNDIDNTSSRERRRR